jgi:predicted DNA-binding WGR domain protein
MKLIAKIEMEHKSDNHNKKWSGELYDNGTIITRWGPIGGWEKSKIFKKGVRAETFFFKKIVEKEKKNYKTVDVKRFE